MGMREAIIPSFGFNAEETSEILENASKVPYSDESTVTQTAPYLDLDDDNDDIKTETYTLQKCSLSGMDL